MEPDLLNEFIPGDQQLTPMGIEPLLLKDQRELPNLKKIGMNVAKNKALEFASGKIGLNTAQTRGLIGLLGIGANIFSPLAAVSALSGRSLGISEYLANKRAQKEMRQKRINDPQGDIITYPTGIMAMQPSNQDLARGSTPSKTTSAPTKSYSPPQQTAGPGGLHNYG